MSGERRSRAMVFVAFQSIVMLGSVVWVLSDPLAVRLLDELSRSPVSFDFASAQPRFGSLRCAGVLMVTVSVLGSLLWELWRRVSRRGSPLTIRRALLITAFVAGWLGLIVNYERIAWQGKRVRSTARVDALERLAERLHADWPAEAGEITGLGPFMAYPIGEPRALLLPTPYPLESTDTVITTVERSNDGSLRFCLGGDDGGDWIEWHPAGAGPTDFLGGLEEDYRVRRAVALEDQWYLVRYTTADGPDPGDETRLLSGG